MTFFVISLINSDDEADDTYSDSESEDGNEYTLEQEYDDDKEDIFDDLEYDDVNSEEEEDQDFAIDFQLHLGKIDALKKKGKENQ